MNTLLKTTGLLVLLGSALPSAFAGSAAAADSLAGRWDAALLDNGPPIPFRLDLSGSGDSLKGTFYDGFRPYETTTRASFNDGKLVLRAEHYLTTITATLKDGALTGDTVLAGPGYSIKYGFRAVRHVDAPAARVQAIPSIAGSWEIPLDSPSSKGEKAFRFIVDQQGADVAASILRVDGDTGAYSGTYRDGKWVLSHFDGQRPGLIEVTARADGTLGIVGHNEALVKALRGNDNEGYSEERYGDETPKYVA